MLDATVGFDATIRLTANSKGRIPQTYLSGVGDSSLGDVQIGVLTPLFGSGLRTKKSPTSFARRSSGCEGSART